jgi:hypothetical protein
LAFDYRLQQSFDPPELSRFGDGDSPGTRNKLRARYGSVSVIAHEMRRKQSYILPLTIRCQKKRPRHCLDNLIVNHFDDKAGAGAVRHDGFPQLVRPIQSGRRRFHADKKMGGRELVRIANPTLRVS